MAQSEVPAPVRFVWTTNGRVRRVDEPITPEQLEAIAQLLRAASEAFNHRDTEDTENDNG
jgi:hypothetical protein